MVEQENRGIDRTKVAVVGVGHLGGIHARVYNELPGAELLAVVDTNKDIADDIAAKYSCQSLYDHRDLFGKVHSVSVAVPTRLHYRVAADLIGKGIHVIIEKPMAQTLEDATSLVQLAKENDIVIQVGHIERFNPAVIAVGDYIDNPRYIECDRIGSYTFRSTDIGVVLDLMIHDIDIILAFVKSEVVSVEGIGLSVFGGYEDMASARLEFANGCIANIRASRISHKRLRKIRFFQQNSYVTVNYGEQKARVFRRAENFSPEKFLALKENPEAINNIQGYIFKHLLDIQEVHIKEEEPLRSQLQSFLTSVRTHSKPIVSGELGLETMRIATHILHAIKTHKRIHLK